MCPDAVRFPSPCGVLVLKSSVSDSWNEYAKGFRPLAGFWFLNRLYLKVSIARIACFRPLAGFWFLNRLYLKVSIARIACFRPLAGFWFLNLWNWKGRIQIFVIVSVPLRGSGS